MFLKKLGRFVAVIFAMWLFVLAIYFLRKGAVLFSPWLFKTFNLDHNLHSFGLGWLSSDLLLSSTPISAAVMALLLHSQLTPMMALSTMVGARIGSCFIILIVGCIYLLRDRAKENLTVGLLTVITTAAIYMPAYVLAAIYIKFWGLPHLGLHLPLAILQLLTQIFEPIVNLVHFYVADWVMFLIGVVLILFSFELVEKSLPKPNIQQELIPAQPSKKHKWRMFGLGVLLVVLTLSMGVTMSLMVPLLLRRIIYREEVVPIALGANIGNFIDLALVALLLGSTPANPAISLVSLLFVSLLLVSLLILLTCYRYFEECCVCVCGFILARNYRWIGFIILMLVIPMWMLWV